MRVLAIVPAYNEEGNIDQVVKSIRRAQPEIDIVVVNDGSSDGTSRLARRAGATVLDLPVNLGIGGAVQTGYKYAEVHGYDVAVQIDGDGQHDPRDVTRLLEVLARGEADMVIGSRFVTDTGYQPPLDRKVGMKIFSFLISKIIRQPIRDTTSGYRAVNRRVIGLFAREYPTDYPEVEVLVLLHRYGFRIKEVPVTMAYRQSGSSSITLWRSIYYVAKVLLAILVMLTRPRTGSVFHEF
ncbi:glycosyltransferase family 2 protein [Neomoorella humiferrea]|uniref:Undecaprenyl-phosphate mannosyltransferase n=1 Tax=Neomoorella humiferrea TaxID=676965 RepID=A0A2T0ANT4_9FIRM|nr:glycosyltransferase family 2 protein [Moorella humiferrea]PRR70675.1 Undecaprenyl-phosphate mannosyltransferase [Moorella humiferrea]